MKKPARSISTEPSVFVVGATHVTVTFALTGGTTTGGGGTITTGGGVITTGGGATTTGGGVITTGGGATVTGAVGSTVDPLPPQAERIAHVSAATNFLTYVGAIGGGASFVVFGACGFNAAFCCN